MCLQQQQKDYPQRTVSMEGIQMLAAPQLLWLSSMLPTWHLLVLLHD